MSHPTPLFSDRRADDRGRSLLFIKLVHVHDETQTYNVRPGEAHMFKLHTKLVATNTDFLLLKTEQRNQSLLTTNLVVNFYYEFGNEGACILAHNKSRHRSYNLKDTNFFLLIEDTTNLDFVYQNVNYPIEDMTAVDRDFFFNFQKLTLAARS